MNENTRADDSPETSTGGANQNERAHTEQRTPESVRDRGESSGAPTGAVSFGQTAAAITIQSLLPELPASPISFSVPAALSSVSPKLISAMRPTFEVTRNFPAAESFSALAQTVSANRELIGSTLRATDSWRSLISADTLNALERSKASDAISALTSSLAATSVLRESCAVGLRASDFLALQPKIVSALTSSLDQLRPATSFSVTARSSVELTDSLRGSLSVIATNLRDVVGPDSSPTIELKEIQGGLSFVVAQRLTSPYLGAAASVLSFEKHLSEVAANSLRISATSLAPLRQELSALSLVTDQTWKSYADLAALRSPPKDDGWIRRPATELYTAAHVVASISLENTNSVEADEAIEAEIDAHDREFEARLGRLDPKLVVVFRGGVERLECGGTDWQRQSMVSFRELATHVLHLLSPDHEVRKIAGPDDIVNEKPTRAVRLRYIFGPVGNGAVATFFAADMRATIALFDLLNNGTHTLGEVATREQVRFIKSRLVGLVGAMLEAQGY